MTHFRMTATCETNFRSSKHLHSRTYVGYVSGLKH
uniref:Uncharacterized protein n=1 Tax=Anguilla anguilla TaxID=7936 RepID=A0A0E9QIU4_ANGAN